MKLYTATVTFDYVVLAEDDDDADNVAREYMRDALNDVGKWDVDIGITEGVTATDWDDECLPYNGDGSTRTGEYKKGIQ